MSIQIIVKLKKLKLKKLRKKVNSVRLYRILQFNLDWTLNILLLCFGRQILIYVLYSTYSSILIKGS